MIGHLLRHDSLLKSAIGHLGRGRPRLEYMKQIMIDMEMYNYKELKELSNNCDIWRSVANQSND